jgi:hypothetical protein
METWVTIPPAECDICGNTIIDEFIDGKTLFGPWATMCPTCHKEHGVGCGTGKGQRYEKQGKDWVKVDG